MELGVVGQAKSVIDFFGTPAVALGIAVIAGIIILGRGGKMNKDAIAGTLERSLPPIAGIIFIVGAGGGFKQVLITTGIGQVIADAVEGSALSVLFLAWLVAVLIRVATGSATVATVTAAGILAPVAADLSTPHVAGDGSRHRRRLAVPLPREQRRFLAGQGLPWHQYRADAEDLDRHGVPDLGLRPGRCAAAQHCHLTGPCRPSRHGSRKVFA